MVVGFLVNDARNSRSDYRSDLRFLCAICIASKLKIEGNVWMEQIGALLPNQTLSEM